MIRIILSIKTYQIRNEQVEMSAKNQFNQIDGDAKRKSHRCKVCILILLEIHM